MGNDFLIKKINAKVEVECHDKGNAIKTVGGDNWNKFISTLDAQKIQN